MDSELSQPVPLELSPTQGKARAYPWWGLGLGVLAGVFVGHPVSMVVQQVQEVIQTRVPFDPGTALRQSFHFIHMWPMVLLYALAGGILGTVLGYILQRLTEQRLLVVLFYHEFELQVATLRHHYKNLAIGIRGFSERVKRNVTKLDQCLDQCAAAECPHCDDFRQDVAALTHNVGILDDTAQRLSATLGQELSFLKALTSDTLILEPQDLYPLLVNSVRDLLDLRFRDKALRVTINGRPWEECRDSLVFFFEPHAMEVILQNLLSNAMKYGDHIRVEVAAAGEQVRVKIQDNGPGLSVEKLQQQLLAPGRPREADSTQLGLKVSLHMVAKCGGRLSVQSRPGADTTFFLEFPRQPHQ